MSRSLWRSLPPSGNSERYLQRCSQRRQRFVLSDDLYPLLAAPVPAQRCAQRPFSTCPRRPAGMKMSMPKIRQKPQPSMSVAREKELAQVIGRGQIPDDVGLFEGTFIMPFGKNRPSWIKNFKARWRLESHRARARLFDWVQNLSYRYWFVRPRPRLHIWSATEVGRKMHKKMYEALAAGDLKPVQGEICTGLLTSLRGRIGQRPASTHLKWTLHKYLTAPRLVSYKSSVMPGPDGRPSKDKEAQNGFTQAIVRIHSLQSLQHVLTKPVREHGKLVTKEVLVDAQGRVLPADEDPETAARRNAKETVEYFVIQKQMKRSKEGPWMVWGTAEESSLQKITMAVKKNKQEKAAKREEKKAEAAAA